MKHSLTKFPIGRRPAALFPAEARPLDDHQTHLVNHASMHVISAGQWQWAEGNHVPLRSLPVSNLVLYHQGKGPITIGNQQLLIKQPETLVCIPQGTQQSARHTAGHPFRASSIHTRLRTASTQQDLLAALRVPYLLELDPQHDHTIIQAFAEITRLCTTKPLSWQARANAHLVFLVHHLIDRFADQFPKQSDHSHQDQDHATKQITPLLTYIDHHLPNGPIAIKELSTIAQLGPESLRRLFHTGVGMSTNRYIQSRRIERACELLANSDNAIIDIAKAVGMRDITAFHRLFRSWMGTTPVRWRAGENELAFAEE